MNLKVRLLNTGLFLDNIYLDKYISIINDNINTKRVKRKTNVHHIVPKYCFRYLGLKIDDTKKNKINLLFKDHVKAHYYLSYCSSNIYCQQANDLAVFYLLSNKLVADEKDLEELLPEIQQNYERCKYNQSMRVKETYKLISPEIRKIRNEKRSKTMHNRITIHKGDIEKRVTQEQFEDMQKDGWLRGRSKASRDNISKSKEGNIPWNKGMVGEYSLGPKNPEAIEKLKGHIVSEETRQKISSKNKGKIYIHKGEEIIKINPEKLEDYTKAGWIKGNPNAAKAGKISCDKRWSNSYDKSLN